MRRVNHETAVRETAVHETAVRETAVHETAAMTESGRRLDASEEVPDGALRVLRRGLQATPELRRGLRAVVVLGLLIAAGRLAIPVLVERALSQGMTELETAVDGTTNVQVDIGLVVRLALLTLAVVIGAALGTMFVQRRLVTQAELGIANLRQQAFEKIHRLSIADHNETRRGVLVARVTSDAESLARFAQWGLYAWAVQPMLILGTFAVLTVYSWQIALVVALAYAPVVPCLRLLQKRQLAAYDAYRTSVGVMLTGFSEAVMGAAVVRAYGAEDRTRQRLRGAIHDRYKARMRANGYMAGVFVVGDVFGAIAFALVLVLGIQFREAWTLTSSELVAALFLTVLMNGPIAELGETLDQTQTAVAGWRKILDLLDYETDVLEPNPGVDIPEGAVAVEARNLGFSYRGSGPVLEDVDVMLPAGSSVAIVGQTGSGKSTFASLLCRLADPTVGEVLLNGVVLSEASPDSRHRSVRMVAQDGFLFDTTIRENVRFGRDGASDRDVEAAFERLELGWWIKKLAKGLDTEVGERGDNLSVGERQLVALARAALADPGLLILDEATSAVDPETDQALTTAIRNLARGRTLVSIAHRLSTAEAADTILVFDQGKLVQQGSHSELVSSAGVYLELHQAWIGNTRRSV